MKEKVEALEVQSPAKHKRIRKNPTCCTEIGSKTKSNKKGSLTTSKPIGHPASKLAHLNPGTCATKITRHSRESSAEDLKRGQVNNKSCWY